MSYTWSALLAVAVAVLVDLFVTRSRLLSTKLFWVSYGIVLFFQLVVNGILTGLGIVTYDPARILGWRIAFAPVEDLLYGFALVTLTLTGWVRWSAGRPGGSGPGRAAR